MVKIFFRNNICLPRFSFFVSFNIDYHVSPIPIPMCIPWLLRNMAELL